MNIRLALVVCSLSLVPVGAYAAGPLEAARVIQNLAKIPGAGQGISGTCQVATAAARSLVTGSVTIRDPRAARSYLVEAKGIGYGARAASIPTLVEDALSGLLFFGTSNALNVRIRMAATAGYIEVATFDLLRGGARIQDALQSNPELARGLLQIVGSGREVMLSASANLNGQGLLPGSARISVSPPLPFERSIVP